MDAGLALPLLVALIGIALAFDFLNGMNDAANAIATVVSTRVLRPHYAVVMVPKMMEPCLLDCGPSFRGFLHGYKV